MGDRGKDSAAKDHGQVSNLGRCVKDCAFRVHAPPMSQRAAPWLTKCPGVFLYSRGHQHSARGDHGAHKEHVRRPQVCSKNSTTHS